MEVIIGIIRAYQMNCHNGNVRSVGVSRVSRVNQVNQVSQVCNGNTYLIIVTTSGGVLFSGQCPFFAQKTQNFGLFWPSLAILLLIYALFDVLLQA